LKHSALDVEQLRGMLLAGAASLANHKDEVNSLNVFPVPDGDTGTNMNLTVESANREISKANITSIKELAEALAMGSLMGARGNSGVILSQIFRGLAKGLAGSERVTPAVFANALQIGVETAYKAVIKPVEGTILTVAKNAARAAMKHARSQDLNALMELVLAEAQATLAKTPEMLPVLKQAGVVDAGGKGLCYIFAGWLDYLEGRAVAPPRDTAAISPGAQGQVEETDLKYCYCTEFIVTGDDLSEEVFRTELEKHGDSLLVVGTSGLIKVHIHTNNPGLVLDFALTQGKELQDIKIDNMRYQHRETIDEPVAPEISSEPKLNGVITVSAGPGLADIFKSMGVDYVVMGGQTMNPSTEDFLQAIAEVKADRIVILPNNGNILMAAQQAAEVADRPVAVVPSKTIPQGLAAMLNYSPDEEDLAFLASQMEAGLTQVKTGQVTYAVRDSVFDGKPISQGNILGIADGKIVAVEEGIAETTLSLVGQMVDEDSEIITLFYGEEVQREEAEAIAARLGEAHPDCEIELHSGGQPLYFFIIAIE
jgi:DAK2 domain fusion protein YloV